MKIVRLQAENFKRIEAIDITPVGNIVNITGKNGSGKTSILDSITEALCGRNKSEIPVPIRDGQKKAQIIVDLDDLQVKKIITSKTTRLEVTNKGDGAKFSSPQSVIDKFVGKFAFDPLSFYELSAEQQKLELLTLLGIQVEVDKINQTIKDYKDRKKLSIQEHNNVCREVPNSPPVKVEKRSLGSLIEELDCAKEAEDLETEKQNLLKTIESLNQQILVANNRILEIDYIKSNSTVRTQVEIREEINNIELHNKKFDVWEKYTKDMAQLDVINNKTEKLRYNIEMLITQRNKIVTEKHIPIKGLTVIDDGLAFRGIPLKQVSSAEQIKISVYLAMKMNPELRVIRIVNGSLLDKDSKKIIIGLANKFDYQVWVEQVADDNSKMGFYIVEGKVANIQDNKEETKIG
jgi:DNA repair exonuclease SbcCD ATPase subunit